MGEPHETADGPSAPVAGGQDGDQRTTRGARRRQELLDAALRLIVRAGPGAVTLRSVVAEAAASHGSVAYYFGSREDLLRAALTLTAARNIEALAAAWPSIADISDIDDMARAIARHSMRQMIEHDDMGVTIIELHLAAARDPGLRPAIVEWGRAFATIVEPSFRALGSAAPAHDAQIVVSAISGLIMRQLAVPSRHFEHEVLAPAIAVHLRACAGQQV